MFCPTKSQPSFEAAFRVSHSLLSLTLAEKRELLLCLEACDIQVGWLYRQQRKENKLFLVISEVLHISYHVGRVFNYQNDLWSGLEELLGGHHFWRGWAGESLLICF